MSACTLRTRLRAALLEARRDRDRELAAALRGVLAALDNAGAVPVHDEAAGAIESSPVGVGASEAARRELTDEDEQRLLAAEVAELRAAASYDAHARRPGGAARLADEIERLARDPDPGREP